MLSNNLKVASILILVSCFAFVVPRCHAQQGKKPFTVADEIGLTLFGDPNGGPPEVHFSPDGNYFAVWSERGRLDLNRPEDSLRFYSSRDVKDLLEHSNQLQPPFPLWVLNRSSYKEGRIIKNWRWLADSSGVAFLEPTDSGDQRLVLADLRTKTIEFLTTTKESVRAFDLRDREHYVYSVASLAALEKIQGERQGPAILGTGRSFEELLFPEDSFVRTSSPPSNLWAVVGGKRFEVKHNGAPLALDAEFALSPDGSSLATILSAGEVPQSWETLYPPPYASSRDNHVHAGRQDVKQYVRINLETGSVQPLTDAPISGDAGWWWGGSGASWSSDGREVLLPGTFIKSRDSAPSRPCVAVVDLPSRTSTCVEMLKVRTETTVEDGYHTIIGAEFTKGEEKRVLVRFFNRADESFKGTEYRRNADGIWQVAEQFKVGRTEYDGLEITVKQGLNDPPLLVAISKQASRILWDPNPQLKKLDLGQASVYTWKDKEGRERKGGLFKPSGYKLGQHYPLVIQTHGFVESEFRPSGVFPTAFAARALAAAGIMVLQVGAVGECGSATPDEGPCNASGYETVANQLVSDGLVDPDRIGIIGFSRTCFFLMETLTKGYLHLKAASITDGVMFTYFQYLLLPDRIPREGNLIIGAEPFGKGLLRWVERSPGFNVDRITSPVLIVGEGPASLLFMWEPYAGLHYLQKPVDLIMLNTDEHVLTNPAVRMASQGGSVDWFRFWLQDYEDPDPKKKEQYERWRGLRKMQEENDAKAKVAKN